MSWMGHPTEGPMPGMATPEEIDRLKEAPPAEADEQLLWLMIRRHRAAIPMAEVILKRTDHPEVRELAGAIAASQRQETRTMEAMSEARTSELRSVRYLDSRFLLICGRNWMRLSSAAWSPTWSTCKVVCSMPNSR
jgi:hypothetical protein